MVVSDVMMLSILNIYTDIVFEVNLQVYYYIQNIHIQHIPNNFYIFMLSVFSVQIYFVLIILPFYYQYVLEYNSSKD